MGHDLENNVPYFAVGLIYALTEAGPVWPMQVYTAAKLIHHFVVTFGLIHDIRAVFWTITNSAFLFMAYTVLKRYLF
jgi:glutathione S-transferase